MLPPWLKPSYIAIAVLALLLGVQTLRLSHSQTNVAEAAVAHSALVADIATKRAEGVEEGVRQQKAAQDLKDAAAASIISGLLSDKIELQKHYDATYGLLKDLAAKPQWGCLALPLPEEVLRDFRR